jgi:hypothetical protein
VQRKDCGVERGCQAACFAVLSYVVLCCAAPGDCYRADHLLEAAIEGALEDAKNPLSPEAKRVRTKGVAWAGGGCRVQLRVRKPTQPLSQEGENKGGAGGGCRVQWRVQRTHSALKPRG